MAKIDFSVELLGYDEERIKRPTPEDEDQKYWTLGKLCCDALMSMLAEEQATLGGDEKIIRNLLARRIFKAEKAERVIKVSSEDVTLLKKLIGKIYGPILVGPSWEALDPDIVVEEVLDGIHEVEEAKPPVEVEEAEPVAAK